MVQLVDIKSKVIGRTDPYDWFISPKELPEIFNFSYCRLKRADLNSFNNLPFCYNIEIDRRYLNLPESIHSHSHQRMTPKNHQFKELAFSFVGDSGESTSVTRAVGDIIKYWRRPVIAGELKETPCLFNLLLGDNFYNNGFKNNNLFESCVRNIFGPDIEHLAVLGNHDYNFWSMGQPPVDLKHSIPFSHDFNYEMAGFNAKTIKGWSLRGRIKSALGMRINDVERVLNQVSLSYSNTQPKWFMPNRYYSATIDKYCIFICADTNRLLWDKDQQIWLHDLFKSIVDKKLYNSHYLFFVGHHPFVTLGKRKKHDEKNNEDDIFHYGNPEKALRLRDARAGSFEVYSARGSYGSALYKLVKEYLSPKIVFDVVIAAHDHFMELLVPNSLGFQERPNEKIGVINKHNFLMQALSGAGGHDVKVINPSIEKSNLKESMQALPGDTLIPFDDPEASKVGLLSGLYKGAGAFKIHIRPERKGIYILGMAAYKNGGHFTKVIEPINFDYYSA